MENTGCCRYTEVRKRVEFESITRVWMYEIFNSMLSDRQSQIKTAHPDSCDSTRRIGYLAIQLREWDRYYYLRDPKMVSI